MAYWIFKVDPERYRIDDRLADPESRTTWQVTRYRELIRSGDTAFIWRTGRNRGLCAIMKITSDPLEMPELELERPYCIALDLGTKWRVHGKFVERFALIPAEKIRLVPGCKDFQCSMAFSRLQIFR